MELTTSAFIAIQKFSDSHETFLQLLDLVKEATGKLGDEANPTTIARELQESSSDVF